MSGVNPSVLLINEKLIYNKDNIWFGQFYILPTVLALAEKNNYHCKLDNSSAVTKWIPLYFERLKQQPVIACFRTMQAQVALLQKAKVIRPIHRYTSFADIFIHWVMEQASLIRLIEPENEDIETIQQELAEKISKWRYDQKNKTTQDDLLSTLEKLQSILEKIYPNPTSFLKSWNGFLTLIDHNCTHKSMHWDPDATVIELQDWIKGGKKGTFIKDYIPRELFKEIWEFSVQNAFNNVIQIIPLIEKKCVLLKKEIKRQSTNPVSLTKVNRAICYLNDRVKPLQEVLHSLKETPFQFNLKHRALGKIKSYLESWDNAKNFPHCPLKGTIPEGLTPEIKVVYDLIELETNTLNECHRLLDTFVSKNLINLQNLWDALESDEQLQKLSSKTDAIAKSITPETKKLKNEKEKGATSKKTEEIPVSLAVKPLASSQYSLKKLLKSSSDQIVSRSCHAELYRRLLRVRPLIEGGDALLITKLFFHNIHLLLESLLDLQLLQKNAPINPLSHNLWPRYITSDKEIPQSIIKKVFQASIWTRFYRNQEKGWSTINQEIPEGLNDLLQAANGKLNPSIPSFIDQVIDSSETEIEKLSEGLMEANIPEKSLNPTSPPSLKQLETLISRLESSQWKDDLLCLQKGLTKLYASKNTTEHALWVSYSVHLLHCAFQSSLYTVYDKRTGTETHKHDLLNLIKELKIPLKETSIQLIGLWLDRASVTSRYPYAFQTPQSMSHRIQLAAIAFLFNPSIDQGFTFNDWVPHLDHYPSIQEQKERLKQAVEELSQIMLEEILPIV